MHNASLIGKTHVAPNQNIVSDGLSKYLDAQNVRYDFLRLPLDIGMDKCDVVVGTNDITERR